MLPRGTRTSAGALPCSSPSAEVCSSSSERPAWCRSSKPLDSATAPWLRNVTEAPVGYSLAERDRRWDAVRERARQAAVDCVLVPLGNDPDARYLTQLRNAAVVLPANGGDPIVIAEPGVRNAWVPDPAQRP